MCLWIKQAGLQQWIYKPEDWLSDPHFQSLQAWNKIWWVVTRDLWELFWAFLSLKPELVSPKHQTKIWRGVLRNAIQKEFLGICVSGFPPSGLPKWLYVLCCPELTHQGGLLQAIPEESTSARGDTNDTCSPNLVIKTVSKIGNTRHARAHTSHCSGKYCKQQAGRVGQTLPHLSYWSWLS